MEKELTTLVTNSPVYLFKHSLPLQDLLDVRNGIAYALRVRESCVDQNTSLIISWVKTTQEWKWLGAVNTIAGSEVDTVRGWHNEGVGAFILEWLDTGTEKWIPIAFANVQSPKSSDVFLYEIGRLIVDPKLRERHFGRLFVDHIVSALRTYLPRKNKNRIGFSTGMKMYARTLCDNAFAIKMLNNTFFQSVNSIEDWMEEEQKNNLSNTDYYWFSVVGLKIDIAPMLKKLREDRNMTQDFLAKEIGIQRSAIAQFEMSNHPALPTYPIMASLFRKMEVKLFETIPIILSPFGPNFRNVEVTKVIDDELADASLDGRYKVNLWIISSELAEAVNKTILDESAQALKEGFERYFFIPEKEWMRLKSKVVEPLQKLCASETRIPLRVYQAPPSLCAMKIAIKNPDVRTKSAVDVSISMRYGKRGSLDDNSAKELVNEIANIVSTINENNNEVTQSGFKLLWPE